MKSKKKTERSDAYNKNEERLIQVDKDYPSTQLKRLIVSRISSGELLPGEKLLSERAMAEEYGVSRMTVQYAMNALAEEGYIEKRRGDGAYVKKVDVGKMDIGYFSSEMGNAGISAMLRVYGATMSNKVLTHGFVKGNFFAKRLELDPDEEVFALHRVRYSNDQPLSVEYAYLPAKYFEGIDNMDFAEVSLYDFMDSRGRLPRRFNEKMKLIQVSDRERKYLELTEKEPVYYMEYVSFDANGDIVEYTESYVRCDKANIFFEDHVR